MEPDRPLILSIKGSIEFKRNQDMSATQEELEYVKEADEYYETHQPEE